MKKLLLLLLIPVFGYNQLSGQCSVTITATSNVSCNGLCNGYVTATGTGGVSPYTFAWSHGPTSPTITGLCAGIYTVTMTDATLCQATTSVTITEPPALAVTSTPTNIFCNGNCNGVIDIMPSGGVPPYSYVWMGPSGFTANSQDIMNLCAGSYSVTITDGNGCTVTTTIVITEPTALAMGFNSVFHESCDGFCNGSANIMTGGGTPPYTFTVDNNPFTPPLTGLCPDTFHVVITDANGCTHESMLTINPGTFIYTNVTENSVSCYGSTDGSAYIASTGGTPPYTLTSFGNVQGNMITDLPAGSYSVTVSDANGCSKAVPVTISSPPQIAITMSPSHVTCFGLSDGSVYVTASNGVAPYFYDIGTGPLTSGMFPALPAGTYAVTVTDYNNCTETATATILEPAELTVNVITTDITCYNGSDGSAEAVVSGGTPGYSISWSNGSTVPIVSGLTAGLISVTVTDANLCEAFSSGEVLQPEQIIVTHTQTDPTCINTDGSIDITVTGGIVPYTFLWNIPSMDEDQTGLSSGIYNLTVTDFNGCIANGYFDLLLQSELGVINGNCFYTQGQLPGSEVELYLFKPSYGGASQMDTAGYFAGGSTMWEFNTLYPDTYYIKANLLNPTSYPELFNSYYDNAFTWANATPVIVNCDDTISLNFTMYESDTVQGGNASISGEIYIFTQNKAVGEPVPGAEVLLEQEPNNVPVMSALTNTSGQYQINGIPAGNDYFLHVEIPGFPMLSTYQNLSINDSDNLTNLHFLVDTAAGGGIFADDLMNMSNFSAQFANASAYPNPFDATLYIDFELNNRDKVKISLFNINGVLVREVENKELAKGIYKYQITGLNQPDGCYILIITSGNTTVVKKLISH